MQLTTIKNWYHRAPKSVALVLALALAGRAMAQPGSNAVLQLPPDDDLTMKPETVIKECTKILDKQQRLTPAVLAMAYRSRGKAYLKCKRWQKALSDLQAFCKLKPKDAPARCDLADALGGLGRTEEALAQVRKALELDPGAPEVHVKLASLWFGQGDLQAAEAAASKAINLAPNFAFAYYTRAVIYSHQGDAWRCLKDVDHFLRLWPDPGLLEHPADAYIMRGTALRELNRPRAALPNFLLARRLEPSSLEAVAGLCDTYADMGKWALALVVAQEGVRIDPHSAVGWCYCADCYAETGKMQEALKAADKALMLEPKSPAVLAVAGRVYRKLGKYEKSLVYYDKALALAKWPDAIAGKVLIFAACPEAKFRNGVQALKLATALYTSRDYSDSSLCRRALLLAAAQAEVGNYGEAVRLARRALDLAGGERYRRDECAAQLKLFKAKKPYRLRVRSLELKDETERAKKVQDGTKETKKEYNKGEKTKKNIVCRDKVLLQLIASEAAKLTTIPPKPSLRRSARRNKMRLGDKRCRV
jgi:tetratricopeptide (TPR) repeat protein